MLPKFSPRGDDSRVMTIKGDRALTKSSLVGLYLGRCSGLILMNFIVRTRFVNVARLALVFGRVNFKGRAP